MTTYAVDFESFYDSDLSVTIQGTVNYAHQTDIYMVAMCGPDVEYVGPVPEAPWHKIDGEHWVSHNAGFDVAIYDAACEKGLVPRRDRTPGSPWYPKPSEWDCTADLMAYLGFPRSLADAVKTAYNVTLDKAMRSSAKGKHWPDDFKPEDQEKMLAYAARDAQYCWQLWNDFSDRCPDHERELSRITRKRCHQGVTVDLKALVHDIEHLSGVREKIVATIPWSDSGVIFSGKKLGEYCVSHDLPIPESTAKNSEEAQKWIDEYGGDHPIIQSMRDCRKANRMLQLLEGMVARVMPNGRMCFGLKYFGAHTGRWSGSEGLNMQNPNKEPVFGVDIRKHLKAAPGKKFIIADYSQIEPRVTAVLVGDKLLLDSLREGYSLYEAFARATKMWDGLAGTLKKTDKQIYALAKAQVLALGYGCGPKKFIEMAKIYADLVISLEESKRIVAEYRCNNAHIVGMWNKLERDMVRSYQRKENHEIKLPSGRSLHYTDLKMVGKPGQFRPSLIAKQGRAKTPVYVWGGLLLENAVQAVARDILAHAILNLEAADIPVLWSAHDEVICEVDEDFPADVIKTIMVRAPKWMDSIPLDVEFVESKHYLK